MSTRPTPLLRLAKWLGRRLLRVQAIGSPPAEGRVLLIANHTSYIDWAAIQLASERPVRFVALAAFFRRWWSAWFLRLFGTIPIEPGKALGSLKSVVAALERGECVCLFAEGEISRHGRLLRLREGYRAAADRGAAPVQAVWIEGLWGARLSFFGGSLLGGMRPRLPGPVTVRFGELHAPGNNSSALLRASLNELGARAFADRMENDAHAAGRAVRALRRMPNRVLIANAPGQQAWSAAEVQVLARDLARRLRALDTRRPACLLPPGAARLALELACACLDLPLLCLEPGSPSDVMQELLASSRADVLLVTAATARAGKLPTVNVRIEPLDGSTGGGSSLARVASWLSARHLPTFAPTLRTVPASPDSGWRLPGVLCAQLELMGLAHGRWLVIPGAAPGWLATWLPLLTPVSLAPARPGTEAGWVAENVRATQTDTIVASAPQLNAWLEHGEPLAGLGLKRILVLDTNLSQADAVLAAQRWSVPVLPGWCDPVSGFILCASQVAPSCPFSTSNEQPASREGSVGRPLPGIALRIILDGAATDESGAIELLAPALGIDQWTPTGVAGRIDADGFVFLE